MTFHPNTYYIWIGGSCDYAHKERAGAAAYIIEQLNEKSITYTTSKLNTTEYGMMLEAMIHAMDTLPELSDIVFMTNVAYLQNFVKVPDPRAKNADLIQACIEKKQRHKNVQIKVVPYHKYPNLPKTHEMAHKAMEQRRNMKTVNVVAAIIIKDNKVFATQRGYGEWQGWWEFPGGKIEPGETPQQALKREIKEELDADITVGNRIDTVEWDYPTFHLSMQCFLCTLNSEAMHLNEHEDAKWLTKEELRTVQWLPADITIINKLILY